MSSAMHQNNLFSAHWYRVREVAPWLAKDVETHRHVYRGKINYVLHRPSVGSHYRLDENAFELIDRLDGDLTVDALWQQALSDKNDDAPTQDELLALLGALHEADLLVVNRRLDTEHLFARREEVVSRRRKERLHNPLFIRFTLVDPDRFLNRIAWLAELLFNRLSAFTFIFLWLFTLMAMLPATDELFQELSTFDPLATRNILMFLLVYPLLKFLHELGHALAVKRCGGAVHEMGIALIILMPMPFVDASASSAFPKKRDRVLVDGAGILVELAITALASLVWLQTQGMLHQLALLVMTVGGISSLFFNGNPLLKFDGYYLLADWLEIPNLNERAKRMVSQGIRWKLLQDVARPICIDRREALWLNLYGVASFVYRLVLTLSIAWMLSERYFLFGVLLSMWALLSSVFLPFFRIVQTIATKSTAPRLRRISVMCGLPAAVLIPLVALPFPMSTTTKGIVWLPDNAVVRSTSDCEITEVLKNTGEEVRIGDILFVCDDPGLRTRIKVLQASLDDVAARRAGIAGSDPVEFTRLQREYSSTMRQLKDANLRLSDLTAIASVNGRFGVEGNTNLHGKFLNAGDVAAYVVPANKRTIKVALTEQDAAWMDSVLAINLRLGFGAAARVTKDTQIVRQTPNASRKLASAGLGRDGGGDLAVELSSDGTLLLEPAFDLELGWPEKISVLPVGTHVLVKFEHSPKPLAIRLSLAVRHAFMGRQSS